MAQSSMEIIARVASTRSSLAAVAGDIAWPGSSPRMASVNTRTTALVTSMALEVRRRVRMRRAPSSLR